MKNADSSVVRFAQHRKIYLKGILFSSIDAKLCLSGLKCIFFSFVISIIRVNCSLNEW